MARIRSGTAGGAVEAQERPEHLSYTQLAMLHPAYRYSCPRKFGYKYRLGLPDERTPALAVGTAFDVGANTYFEARQAGQDTLVASGLACNRAIDRIRAEDVATFETPERQDQYEDLLLNAFAAFLTVEGKAEVAVVQSRHAFTLKLDDVHVMPVVGYSDRIDSDGTLVDHKFSGSPRWNKVEGGNEVTWHEEWVAERRDQLLIYWLARRAEEKRLGAPLLPPLSGRARLVVTYHRLGLLHPQVRACDLTLDLEGGGNALLQRLAEAARIAQADRYPARPGPPCGFCTYRERCREDEEARGRPFFELIDVPF